MSARPSREIAVMSRFSIRACEPGFEEKLSRLAYEQSASAAGQRAMASVNGFAVSKSVEESRVISAKCNGDSRIGILQCAQPPLLWPRPIDVCILILLSRQLSFIFQPARPMAKRPLISSIIFETISGLGKLILGPNSSVKS